MLTSMVSGQCRCSGSTSSCSEGGASHAAHQSAAAGDMHHSTLEQGQRPCDISFLKFKLIKRSKKSQSANCERQSPTSSALFTGQYWVSFYDIFFRASKVNSQMRLALPAERWIIRHRRYSQRVQRFQRVRAGVVACVRVCVRVRGCVRVCVRGERGGGRAHAPRAARAPVAVFTGTIQTFYTISMYPAIRLRQMNTRLLGPSTPSR